MNSITNDVTQKQSSPLDEFLKAQGLNQAQENGLQQDEDTSTQSMTIANFSMQSIVMANANSTQNSLLASVMGAASSSTAETSSERTAFGKQTAANMLQGMEKDNFEQNVSDLLEGLKTDIEEAAEEKLNEAAGLTTSIEEPTSVEETSIVEEDITVQGEQSSMSSTTTQTAVTTVQVVTEAQSAGAAPAAEAAPPSEASSATSGEAPEVAKAPVKSVDTYV